MLPVVYKGQDILKAFCKGEKVISNLAVDIFLERSEYLEAWCDAKQSDS